MSYRKIAYALSILLIFMLPWRSVLTIAEGVTAARVLGLLGGLFWIFYLVSNKYLRRLNLSHLALFGFVVWQGLSALWTLDLTATLFVFFSLFASALFSLLLWDLFRTERDLAKAALAFVVGNYVAIALNGFGFVFLGNSRVADVTSGPNYLAPTLIFGIPLAWYLAARSDSFDLLPARRLGIAYIPVASIAVLFTKSRQGLVLLTVALLSTFALQVRFNDQVHFGSSIRYALFGIASTVAAGLLVLDGRIQDALPFDRMEKVLGVLTGSTSVEQAELGKRIEIYSAGVEAFVSNYLFGTGAGSFPSAVAPLIGQPEAPHSTYLTVSVEGGVIGLGLFLILIWSLVRGLFDVKSKLKMLGLMLLILYSIASLVNTWIYSFTAFFVLTVVLLSGRTGQFDQNSR